MSDPRDDRPAGADDLTDTGPLEATVASAFSPMFADGELLAGRFRIVRLLGRGGMGEVYEAEDLDVRERVALKAIRPEIAQDEHAIDRFRREIHLARRVTHPNVCRIFDLLRHRIEAPGQPARDVAFISMELLRGPNLAEVLHERGRMSSAAALPLVRQMASALDAAHAAGVVHQDFKTANVVVGRFEDGAVRAVVTDFGLALRHGPGERGNAADASGQIQGTPGYMAPEQLERGRIGPATDIYALGLVMYEMVTGALPFSGDTRATAALKRLTETPPPPRSRVPDLEPVWETVILRCLERDPARRFASAGDAASALGDEGPHHDELEVQLRREKRRNRLVAAAAVALATGVALWSLLTDRGREAGPPLKAVQVTANTGVDMFPAFSPDGLFLAYSSNRTGSFEIYTRPLAPGGRDTPLTRDGKQNLQPAWSPDGRSIAYYSKERGGIWIAPASGGEPRPLADFGSRPAWSPDGSRITFQSDPVVDLAANYVPARPPSTIWVRSLDGGAPVQITRAGVPAGGHGVPWWSPDGERVLFVTYERRASSIWSVAATGGEPDKLLEGGRRIFDAVGVSDGSAIFFTGLGESGGFGIWRAPLPVRDGAPAGTPALVASLTLGTPRQLAVSADGRRIVYSALSMPSNIWSLRLSPASEPVGSPVALTSETGRSSRPSFSPDGSRIAFDKWYPGANPDIWVMDADGENAAPLTTDPADDTTSSWTPDGRGVVFLSLRGGKKGLWSVDVGSKGVSLVAPLDRSAESPHLSPDGTRLAFDSSAGAGTRNLWVMPLVGGTPRQVTFDHELIAFPSWSPDGRLLAAQMRRRDVARVVVVPSSGGPQRELTSDDAESWAHTWSPDGDKVVFARLGDGFWNVWWVSRTTGERRQLTHYDRLDAYVRYPAWSPLRSQLVYEYAETTGNVWMIEAPR